MRRGHDIKRGRAKRGTHEVTVGFRGHECKITRGNIGVTHPDAYARHPICVRIRLTPWWAESWPHPSPARKPRMLAAIGTQKNRVAPLFGARPRSVANYKLYGVVYYPVTLKLTNRTARCRAPAQPLTRPSALGNVLRRSKLSGLNVAPRGVAPHFVYAIRMESP